MNSTTGKNYIEGEDGAETAKRVRKAVRQHLNGLNLKISVRLSRFSMGKSIDVTLTGDKYWFDDDNCWYPNSNFRQIKREIESLVDSFKLTHTSGWPDDYYYTTFYSNVTLKGA